MFSHASFYTSIVVYIDKGIGKHTLDRPFTKNTGVDHNKKKGAKRSRRRGPGENEHY